jgi:hypothetical protein
MGCKLPRVTTSSPASRAERPLRKDSTTLFGGFGGAGNDMTLSRATAAEANRAVSFHDCLTVEEVLRPRIDHSARRARLELSSRS